MRFLVTGGSGFIGSHLVDTLLSTGHDVSAYDNLSTGRKEFLHNALEHPHFKFILGDLLDKETLRAALKGIDFVFHLAANADVRFGTNHPERDLEQNTIATFQLLEAMRFNDVRKLAFSSTGSIYGEAAIIPTPENVSFPIQTSLYGASKLACEGLIQAYAEGFGLNAWIFRFVSILGERYTHGHVFDFYKKLLQDSKRLEILGDGLQKKSYLYVHDCIAAMMTAIEKSKQKVNIFNLGTEEYIQVNDSVRLITEDLGFKPELAYSGGDRGWIGDNPFIFLDTTKIRNLGWKPRYTIREAILKTLHYLKQNQFVLERA